MFRVQCLMFAEVVHNIMECRIRSMLILSAAASFLGTVTPKGWLNWPDMQLLCYTTCVTLYTRPDSTNVQNNYNNY